MDKDIGMEYYVQSQLETLLSLFDAAEKAIAMGEKSVLYAYFYHIDVVGGMSHGKAMRRTIADAESAGISEAEIREALNFLRNASIMGMMF